MDAWYRMLAHYFRLEGSGAAADYVHTALAPFRVPRDLGEDRVPAVPGFPPVYRFRPGTDGYDGTVLTLNDHELFRSRQNDRLINHAMWHVQREAMHVTGDFFLVHAGAVTAPGGGALLLPAPPDSGKTTLTAGLVRAGFGYLSDEAAAIDPVTHDVHPFPKTLNLEVGSMGLFPELASTRPSGELGSWHVQADELRPGSLAEPAPVRWVVTPRYVRDAPTRLRSISRAEGLAVLLENAHGLRRYGVRGAWLLESIARGARHHRLVSGDLHDAVAALEQLTRGAS